MILKHLPLPKGFYAINICGLILCREQLSDKELQHERIHSLQQRELLFVGFYLLYVMEWFVRVVQHRNFLKAYFSISFEKEAYRHQSTPDYLKNRKPYAFTKHLHK